MLMNVKIYYASNAKVTSWAKSKWHHGATEIERRNLASKKLYWVCLKESRYFELFWPRTKLPLNWRKRENSSLLRVRFFTKIQDWILKSENEFCVSLLNRSIQDHRRIHSGSGFFGSFDAPWSKRSWINLFRNETHNLFSDLRIQSSVFLKKRTLR